MVFVGPTPEVIDGLGDKVSARTLAIKANVPVVPGTPGPIDNVKDAEDFVAKFGYPVIIKAAYGGGGRGMRVVREGESIADAFNRASSEYATPNWRNKKPLVVLTYNLQGSLRLRQRYSLPRALPRPPQAH